MNDVAMIWYVVVSILRSFGSSDFKIQTLETLQCVVFSSRNDQSNTSYRFCVWDPTRIRQDVETWRIDIDLIKRFVSVSKLYLCWSCRSAALIYEWFSCVVWVSDILVIWVMWISDILELQPAIDRWNTTYENLTMRRRTSTFNDNTMLTDSPIRFRVRAIFDQNNIITCVCVIM